MNHQRFSAMTGIVISVILRTIFLLAACSPAENVSSGSLQILSHKMSSFAASTGRQSTAAVSGRAQNTGDVTITSATISVEFFDEQGKPLQAGSTTRQNLAPGEIWEFAVETSGADAWKIMKYTVRTTVSQ